MNWLDIIDELFPDKWTMFYYNLAHVALSIAWAVGILAGFLNILLWLK